MNLGTYIAINHYECSKYIKMYVYHNEFVYITINVPRYITISVTSKKLPNVC